MGSLMLILIVLLPLSLSILAPRAGAWGIEGHSMICKLAEKNLTANAKAAVLRLLPASAGNELAAVCSWADQNEARERYPCSGGLHFINNPDDSCEFIHSRDCADDACVAGAINKYASALKVNYSRLPPGDLTDSLMFLVHFMGDVHQPLHVGHKGDRGGNKIKVFWLSSPRKVNLHRVWDTEIIRSGLSELYNNDQDKMTRTIEARYITTGKISISGTVDAYASESSKQACDYAYQNETNGRVDNNSKLTRQYFQSRLPIVEERIAQAGARLAAMLNSIFHAVSDADSRPQIE